MPFFRTRVLENRTLGATYHALIVEQGRALGHWRAGQFTMVRAWPGVDPLLPRAFSVYGRGPGETFEILLKRVGPGTDRLAALRPGDPIDVHGPLGRPFDLPEKALSHTHLLVGGGVGIAPLLPLAVALRGARTILLYGGRSVPELVAVPDFEGICEVRLATDDGSAGRHGFVTELLAEELRAHPAPIVYACGPEPMLAGVAKMCREAGVVGQLCLEAPMACGYGACLGCVVSTASGYRRVCREGPVFRESEVYV